MRKTLINLKKKFVKKLSEAIIFYGETLKKRNGILY